MHLPRGDAAHTIDSSEANLYMTWSPYPNLSTYPLPW